MKMLPAYRRTHASTLVLTVIITALIGLVLVAYLALMSHQNAINFRSQVWNSAMPLVEAGLEHSLAHLNANLELESGKGLELARDGWIARGSAFLTTNWIGNERYELTILNYVVGAITNTPEVVSVGYVVAPYLAAAPTPAPFLALAGAVNSSASQSFIIRAVHIRCRTEPFWSKAILAKDRIDLKGNKIRSDSFDSTDPNYSTNGQYCPTLFKAGGDIGCNSSIVDSFNIGDAEIYGHVATGPGSGIAIGPNGFVGDVTWTPVGSHRIEPGWYKDDMNMEFDPITTPFDPMACVPPQPAWITNQTVQSTNGVTVTNNVGTYYNYVLTDNSTSDSKWIIATLSGKTYVRGNVMLYVSDRINLAGSDCIVISPGSSLKLYMAGATASIGGAGIINYPGSASNCTYYGLPSNTSVSYGGNSTFVGTINAPNAALSFGGGGSTVNDYIGACIARTVTLNGHFSFHYDEALRRGPVRAYVVTLWNELSPEQVRQYTAPVIGIAALPSAPATP